MHSGTWKQFERDCAEFMGGKRFPANMGGPIDGESPSAVWQCKKKSSLSHSELARETIKMDDFGNDVSKLGVVLHQNPRKAGIAKVRMITMSWEMFDAWFSMRPLNEEAEHGEQSTEV